MATNIRSSSQLYIDASLNLNTNKVINMVDGVAASDGATVGQLNALIGAANAMVFKGVIDCSTNPNYPAADAGWAYRVSVAGKIGGASGINVEIGDMIICITDSTASGTQVGVGSAWTITQANLDGAVIGPASATNNGIALFDTTTGKLIKDSAKTIVTTLGADDTTVPTSKATKDAITASAETATTIGALINGAAAATPNDTDLVATALSGGILQKITWSNVKSFLKTYFDTLYAVKTVRSYRVTPTGTVNGSNVTFTISALVLSGTEEVFKNGVLQNANAGVDYTISYGATTTITFASAPSNVGGYTDVILVNYSV